MLTVIPMVDKHIAELKTHMDKTIQVFEHELIKLRTGRANPAMVEDVKVEYYGTHTPLKHLARITAPEPDLIVIQPFDKSQVHAIEKAIQAANLGFNPVVEGDLLRIKIPRLTEERRKELSKIIREKAEEAKIALRNIRRDVKEKLDKEKKEGILSEDDHERLIKELDKVTHEYTAKVDAAAQAKEKQLLSV
jgi:ribosome recycling factor